MEVALSQSILKCVSTDTVREVARRLTAEPSPALMRSSYDGEGDPVVDWNDCCSAISAGVDALVKDDKAEKELSIRYYLQSNIYFTDNNESYFYPVPALLKLLSPHRVNNIERLSQYKPPFRVFFQIVLKCNLMNYLIYL
jgi:hypothetical protein